MSTPIRMKFVAGLFCLLTATAAVAQTSTAAVAQTSTAPIAEAPPAVARTPVAEATRVAATKSAELLFSWQNTESRRAIEAFVTRVTTPGKDFVPVEERIAVFDNDGTLWAEHPLYFQFLFAQDRVRALAPSHPEWKTQEPFASLLKGDVASALSVGEEGVLTAIAGSHQGMTVEEYQDVLREWFATARNPATGLLYTDMAYQPMVELLKYMRANGFKTYIVSGGGVEFIRGFAEKAYGIPPEQVIGSSGIETFVMRDGRGDLVKQPGMQFLVDQGGKAVAIWRVIGRRPIAAFGNSDGDLEMLQWTAAGGGPRFCLYVHHTDAKREWAYDRHSDIGRLDKGLDAAQAGGWTVVDMAKDWKTMYVPDGKAK